MKGHLWDRFGAAIGGICAVHCVLTGFALGLLSTAGFGFIASEPAEWAFVGTAVTVGAVALVHGFRRHHSITPALIFCTAMATLVTAQLIHSGEHRPGGGHSHHGHSHDGPEHADLPAGISEADAEKVQATLAAAPHSRSTLSALLNVLGGLLVVVFHVVNQRLQHVCGGVHCAHKPEPSLAPASQLEPSG
jgi:hypothetical protein